MTKIKAIAILLLLLANPGNYTVNLKGMTGGMVENSYKNIIYRCGNGGDAMCFVYNLISELILAQKVPSIKGKEH